MAGGPTPDGALSCGAHFCCCAGEAFDWLLYRDLERVPEQSATNRAIRIAMQTFTWLNLLYSNNSGRGGTQCVPWVGQQSGYPRPVDAGSSGFQTKVV